MKKIILLSLIASSFVFGNTIELRMQESVESKITPTMLSGHIGVQEFGLTQNEVREKMDAVLTIIKKTDVNKSCSGGGYSSYPKNEWINGKSVRQGYTAHLNLSCKTKTIEGYDSIVSAANSVISPTGTISQSELSWVASDADLNLATHSMKIALIKKSLTSAANLSSEFGWDCGLAEINIGGSSSVIRPVSHRGDGVMMSAMRTEQDTTAPIAQDISERLSANLTIACKTSSFSPFDTFVGGGDAAMERMPLMQKDQITKRGSIAEAMRLHAEKICTNKACTGKKGLSNEKGNLPHMCPLDNKCEKSKRDKK